MVCGARAPTYHPGLGACDPFRVYLGGGAGFWWGSGFDVVGVATATAENCD